MFWFSNLHPIQIIVKDAFLFLVTLTVFVTSVSAGPKVKFTPVYENLETKLPVSLMLAFHSAPADHTISQLLHKTN